MVDQDALELCQKLIDYRFKDPALLNLALTHASVAPTRLESNERLEFLGDAVLGVVVCNELYDTCPDLLEGEMTRVKSSVVSRHTCAAIAEQTGLAGTLLLGKGMAGPAGPPQSVLAAVFESIIGAVYLDGGLEAAGRFVLRHVQPYIEAVLADEHLRNYKSMLQQYAQRHWNLTPEYLMLDEKGPDHAKCFEVAVAVGGRHFPSAWGKNKKEAEQKAAREALAAMDVLTDEAGQAERPLGPPEAQPPGP